MKARICTLIVDDDIEYLRDMRLLLAKEMKVITAAFPELALKILREESVNVILLDIDFAEEKRGIDWLEKIHEIKPRIPVIMVSYFDAPEMVVEALQRGAVDYIHKLSDLDVFLAKIKKAIGKYYIEENLSRSALLFKSQAMEKVLNEVEMVARTNSTVLLLGESGVGKTMIAKLIHEKSKRKDKKFVTLNVPSITPTLFESELFGHKRGAFTGAINDKVGRVELAEGGTLFLDEISETSPEIQAKLLRLLEDKEYEKVGDSVTAKADIRVIAASNKKFDKLIEEGKFRRDLYYRLSHLIIEIPPLRERKEDIELLAKHFLKKACQELEQRQKFFNEKALEMLKNYSWPGNVRELMNFVERLVVKKGTKREITENDVKENLNIESPEDSNKFLRFEEYKERELRKVKFEYFYRLLQKTAGNISKTARLAGISRQSLYRFLSEVGLQKNDEL